LQTQVKEEQRNLAINGKNTRTYVYIAIITIVMMNTSGETNIL